MEKTVTEMDLVLAELGEAIRQQTIQLALRAARITVLEAQLRAAQAQLQDGPGPENPDDLDKSN